MVEERENQTEKELKSDLIGEITLSEMNRSTIFVVEVKKHLRIWAFSWAL